MGIFDTNFVKNRPTFEEGTIEGSFQNSTNLTIHNPNRYRTCIISVRMDAIQNGANIGYADGKMWDCQMFKDDRYNTNSSSQLFSFNGDVYSEYCGARENGFYIVDTNREKTFNIRFDKGVTGIQKSVTCNYLLCDDNLPTLKPIQRILSTKIQTNANQTLYNLQNELVDVLQFKFVYFEVITVDLDKLKVNQTYSLNVINYVICDNKAVVGASNTIMDVTNAHQKTSDWLPVNFKYLGKLNLNINLPSDNILYYINVYGVR